MSQENVERARRFIDAYNRRDLDALLGLMDPDVVFTTRFAQMEGGSQYRGHDDVREWWDDLLAIFPDISIEALEVRDLGERMIIAVCLRGHGGDSDTPFEQTVWGAGEWRDGRLVRWQTFGSEAEALEAAGLSE
jgi:ketosteroid isomerase-like protein